MNVLLTSDKCQLQLSLCLYGAESLASSTVLGDSLRKLHTGMMSTAFITHGIILPQRHTKGEKIINSTLQKFHATIDVIYFHVPEQEARLQMKDRSLVTTLHG